ncbi:MAG: hypothetical protein AB7G62_01405 [Magnetospirillum sp.]
MKRDHSQNAPKIQPLVKTLNGTPNVNCRRAYDGHVTASISPFIEFDAPSDVASMIALRLQSLWTEKQLNYWWEVAGSFCCDGRLEFTLRAPRLNRSQGIIARFHHFVVNRKRIDDDLWVIHEKALAQVNIGQNVCKIMDERKPADAPAALQKALSFLAVVFLSTSLAACGSNREIQKDGSGTDEMLKSPCACVPVPYQAPTYKWVS